MSRHEQQFGKNLSFGRWKIISLAAAAMKLILFGDGHDVDREGVAVIENGYW